MTGIDLGIGRDVHVELPLDLLLQDYKPGHKTAAEFERKFIQFAIDNKASRIYEVRVSKHADDCTWTLETFLFADKEEALKLAKEHDVYVREYDLRDKARMSANEFFETMSRSANVELAMQWHRIINQKTIYLSLKRKWFEMIASGEKKEEYREIKAKYFDAFCEQLSVSEPNCSNDFGVGFHLNWPETYDKVVFTLGYPKSDDNTRRIEFKNPRIRIDYGKTEWGAIPGRKYFVITWDEHQQ